MCPSLLARRDSILDLSLLYSWSWKVTGIGWPGRPLTNSGYFLWPRVAAHNYRLRVRAALSTPPPLWIKSDQRLSDSLLILSIVAGRSF